MYDLYENDNFLMEKLNWDRNRGHFTLHISR